jgi:hypothetical protein
MTDVNAPLEQQLLHIPIGKQKTMVEIDGIRDDCLWEMVAFGTLS